MLWEIEVLRVDGFNTHVRIGFAFQPRTATYRIYPKHQRLIFFFLLSGIAVAAHFGHRRMEK